MAVSHLMNDIMAWQLLLSIFAMECCKKKRELVAKHEEAGCMLKFP